MSEQDPEVIRSNEVYGERDPAPARPVPNKADAAFEELAALQAEAAELGIEGADWLPLGELRQQVEAARADG
jgi:hypothetical protein